MQYETEITTCEWLEWAIKASAIAERKDIISYSAFFEAAEEVDRLKTEAGID